MNSYVSGSSYVNSYISRMVLITNHFHQMTQHRAHNDNTNLISIIIMVYALAILHVHLAVQHAKPINCDKYAGVKCRIFEFLVRAAL